VLVVTAAHSALRVGPCSLIRAPRRSRQPLDLILLLIDIGDAHFRLMSGCSAGSSLVLGPLACLLRGGRLLLLQRNVDVLGHSVLHLLHHLLRCLHHLVLLELGHLRRNTIWRLQLMDILLSGVKR